MSEESVADRLRRDLLSDDEEGSSVETCLADERGDLLDSRSDDGGSSDVEVVSGEDEKQER